MTNVNADWIRKNMAKRNCNLILHKIKFEISTCKKKNLKVHAEVWINSKLLENIEYKNTHLISFM